MNANAPIPTFLDRRPLVWSYSLLHAFADICPHQGQARYIDKTIQFVETEAVKRGNAIHSAMEHRVGGGKPLPLDFERFEKYARIFDGRPVKTESWYQVNTQGRACDRWAKDKFGHGKIDLTLINGTTGYIGDWKSGSSKYEDPFELEVNAVLLHAKHPQLKVIKGQYFWLGEDRVSQLYDLSNTAATWQRICSIMRTVLNWRQLGEFPKKRSGLCGFCQRWDCDENSNPDRPT